eukprot:TRINITY_DN2578_c0_g3_i4.p1 TRINITY_DN2578_c0_g3~~TRINITY_DN2578_c0_g3_i4.p1  ORF type:complete len:146 (+),score=21.87 TRINITY_DN2578_c0_g3_i4:598-1035(+)
MWDQQCSSLGLLLALLQVMVVLPYAGCLVGKLYFYNVAMHFKTADSLRELHFKRFTVSINLRLLFGCALLAWVANCYCLLWKDGVLPTTACVRDSAGRLAMAGGKGLLGSAWWSYACLVIGFPLSAWLVLHGRDGKATADHDYDL